MLFAVDQAYHMQLWEKTLIRTRFDELDPEDDYTEMTNALALALNRTTEAIRRWHHRDSAARLTKTNNAWYQSQYNLQEEQQVVALSLALRLHSARDIMLEYNSIFDPPVSIQKVKRIRASKMIKVPAKVSKAAL